MAFPRSKRGVLVLVLCLLSLVSMLLTFKSGCTVAAVSSGEGIILIAAAGNCNANHSKHLVLLHAPVISRPAQSQLHQHVVRVLRTARYKASAALLDNKTESVVRQRITVFATSDHGGLSDFQKKMEELRQTLEYDTVRFHIIPVQMPFSNLLRLEVGSRLTMDVSNISILVKNATEGAYKVDDVVIVNPDLFKNATMAVHGFNAVFNISKILEAEPKEPVNGGGSLEGGFPHVIHICASEMPINVKGVSVYQILMSFAALFLI